MAQRNETRARILDAAQQSVLMKGFEATSIEEIVAAAEITKGGFFYHFPDKSALAKALIERYVADDARIFEGLIARARDLSDDPLQQLLISLKLLSEVLYDMPAGHPGCLIASAAYQERMFSSEVRETNRRAVLGWRDRVLALLQAAAERYPPQEPVALEDVADMVNAIAEGGIVLSKALGDPHVTARQVVLLRIFLRLLFAPRLQ